jgi:type I restriction enzyme R subunit
MEEHGVFRRRRLPHWDLPGATYFVTACLAGSIPAQGLLDLARYRARLAKMPTPKEIAKKAWDSAQWRRAFARSDWWLDHRSAVRHFADPALAASVVEAIYYWAGRRYDVLAYVVMPSHLHWVFRPREEAEGLGQVGNLLHGSDAARSA